MIWNQNGYDTNGKFKTPQHEWENQKKTIYYNNNLKNVKYEKITYFINNTSVALCNHTKCNGK